MGKLGSTIGTLIGEAFKGFAWGLGITVGITVWAHLSVALGFLPYSQ